MLHTHRVWTITTVSRSLLVDLLTKTTWCLCNGFRCDGLLWLNDSTSADGAQEFAVIRESDGRQLESITVGWCSAARLLEYHEKLSAPGAEPQMSWVLPSGAIDSREGHECHHCA